MEQTIHVDPDGDWPKGKAAVFAVVACVTAAAIGGMISLKLDTRRQQKAMKEFTPKDIQT